MSALARPTGGGSKRPELRRWIAFNAVGAAGVVVQIGTAALLLRALGWHYLLATGLAVEAAVVHNFVWHQAWTWKDRPVTSARSIAARLLRFQMLNGFISLAGNLAIVAMMVALFNINPLAANALAIVACATFNYLASDVLVFRRQAAVVMLAVAATASVTLEAQSPAALAGWQQYVSALEVRYTSAPASAAFFVHDTEAAPRDWRDSVKKGAVSIVRIEAPPVSDARVHHWIGAVFVPGLAVDALVTRLKQQAGHESAFYADVTGSRLLAADGDRLRIYMKLRRTALITVTYNTEHAVEYRRIGATRASARSEATRIAELKDVGTPREREAAPGEDNGFLWRLGAYWRYESASGGVLVECESVSLSRPVPALLRPIANPIVDRIARESLERTLLSLREMALPPK